MKAFYLLLLPPVGSFYPSVQLQTHNFALQFNWQKIEVAVVIVLGVMAIVCLLLDFLECAGIWQGALRFVFNKNNAKVNGSIYKSTKLLETKLSMIDAQINKVIAKGDSIFFLQYISANGETTEVTKTLDDFFALIVADYKERIAGLSSQIDTQKTRRLAG